MSRSTISVVRRSLILILALLLLGSLLQDRSALAQTVSISAGIGVDVKRFSGSPETSVLDTSSPGIQLGLAATATPNLSVHLELGLEGSSTVTKTSEVRLAELRTSYTSRMRTVSVLAGLHPAATGRFRWNVLAGLTFVNFNRKTDFGVSSLPPGTSVIAPPTEFVDRVAAATVGADAAIHVTGHFAIVPAIRAHAFRLAADLSGFSVWPSIGAQWVF